ncbi:MAG: MotA/TolQ/ExbB proton channel family protein [Acidobacteria bacterium]|nr:MotA/TolQ/ExbB proton channel family protein [Acidobacteriota bacterium]
MLLQVEPPADPFGGSFSGLLAQTSAFAIIILLLLLAFSLLSWTIIFRKWLTFRQIGQKSQAFISMFRKSSRLSEVSSACELYRDTPIAGIFSAGYRELNAQIKTANSADPNHPVLVDRQIVGIQRALQRASSAELSILEKGMSWLATTGSVTPFIGLLGTVVGIISAFSRLGFGGATASIQAVAPGIADALIATAAGLFAAIPAVIAYNHFVARMKNIAAEMDDFSSEFLNLVERSFS